MSERTNDGAGPAVRSGDAMPGFREQEIWSTTSAALEIRVGRGGGRGRGDGSDGGGGGGGEVELVGGVVPAVLLKGVSIVFGVLAVVFLSMVIVGGSVNGVVGWLVVLLLVGIFSAISLACWWVSNLSGSRLWIAVPGGALRSEGARWTVPGDGSARAEGVEFRPGEMRRHGDTLERMTWRVRLRCSAAGSDGERVGGSLVVLEGWPEHRVREKARRVAMGADLPLVEIGLDGGVGNRAG
ncbi:MAG: hypothetical protein ACTS3F_11100 [Phycisphaerales bacterium]